MKPRILFIMHFPPPLNGGASFMGKSIKESLKINNNFDAEYINLTTSFSLRNSGRAGFGKLVPIIKILFKVAKALLRKNYDLCYMTLTAAGPGFYKDLLVVFILKVFRTKIIYHFHNKGVNSTGKTKFSAALYRFTFRNTQSILISPLLYSDIQKYVKAADVFYCANGISLDESMMNAKIETIKKNTDVCRLLYLSNMMYEKGAFVLLEACSKLKDRNIKFECHFVGEWTNISESEFNHYVETHDLTENVFAHGPKYLQEKVTYFENSDIFIFPTFFHYETFGLVNLEAMQHSLPIISTPEGGIPDVVLDGVTGYLVPQHDVEALANKVQTLSEDPGLRLQMGAAGKQRFLEKFTFERFEENFINTIKWALKKNTIPKTTKSSNAGPQPQESVGISTL